MKPANLRLAFRDFEGADHAVLSSIVLKFEKFLYPHEAELELVNVLEGNGVLRTKVREDAGARVIVQMAKQLL